MDFSEMRSISVSFLVTLFCFLCGACASKPPKDSFDSMESVVGGQVSEQGGAGIIADQVITGATNLRYEEKISVQQEIIKRQEQQLLRQQKELDHLQRQNYYNKALEKYQKQ